MMSHCLHCNLLPPKTCSFCNYSLPESLFDICINFINKNLDLICVQNDRTNQLKLKGGTFLPVNVCEKLLSLQATSSNSNFIKIFKNTKDTRLKKVKICDVTNDQLEFILKHDLVELNITHNNQLTEKSIDYLNNYGQHLTSLIISGSTIFPTCSGKIWKKSNQKYQGYILSLPSLKKLVLRNQVNHFEFFSLLLKNMTNLTHLDLSNCHNLGDFEYAIHLTNLQNLILHNNHNVNFIIPTICKLKNLKHLDISDSFTETDDFLILSLLIDSLPNLTSLDISETSLALSGLESRRDTPFHYLGLYGLPDACTRTDLPAKLVAGNANEEQLLVAALAFLDRPELLLKVLKEISQLVRSKSCTYCGHILHVVFETMGRHFHNRDIQIAGGTILADICKVSQPLGFGLDTKISVKRKILTVLLDALSVHLNNLVLVRHLIMVASYFHIPEDVLFDFERLTKILLGTLGIKNNSNKKKVLQFLNTLACNVDIPEKIKMGELGIMEKMIWLNKKEPDCEETLEFAWTIMWNATDETPSNSRRFVELHGMKYFSKYYQEYFHDDGLLSSMMGLIANVSEVCDLHPYLMDAKYLEIFSHLLDSECDGIEVSYSAAGIIAYLASNGEHFWTFEQPSRSSVLNKLDKTIDRWDLKSKRGMMFRTFKPVWYLVKIFHAPECQKWGIWTLANLTNVYPEKYCDMIEKEGGLVLLQQIMDHCLSPHSVTELTSIVIENCRNYKKFLIF